MMHTTIAKSLITVLAICLQSSLLHAEDKDGEQNDNYIVIGVGYVEQHAPFNSSSSQALPIPIISIKQGVFYFEGLEAGIHLDKEAGEVTPSLDIFVTARSPSGRDRLTLTADAGARLSLKSDFGVISGEFRHDITDTFSGSEVIARYSYPFSTGKLTIVPSVRASWLDQKAANFMYGVTAAQRTRMIRKGRSVILPVAPITDEALNLGGDISMALQLNQRLTLVATVGGAYLDQSMQRSAAIDQKWEAQSGLGITYRF